jgi:mannose-6-phosphate isomerase-like protein (cupin superfamily)
MLLSGAGSITFVEGEQRIDAGDSFYMPSGLPHGFRVPPDGEAVLMINVEAPPGTDARKNLAKHLPRMAREAEALDAHVQSKGRGPK